MTTEQETTETQATETDSDKDRNWRAMEEKLAAANERLAELEPLAHEKAVKDAGFDPESERGQALILAIEAGKAESSKESISEFAESRGWEPTPTLTENEQSQVEGSQRVTQVRSETSSETPPDLDSQIAEAEEAGDWSKAGLLKLQRMGAGT